MTVSPRPDDPRPAAIPPAPPGAKAAPPPLTARAPRPAAVRLRKPVAQAAVLGAATILAGALAWAFVVQPELRAQARDRADGVRAEETRGTVRPSEAVTGRPASYDRLATDQLPEPRRLGRANVDRDPSGPATRAPRPASATAHRAGDRMALAAQARTSSLFFEGRGASAGGGEHATAEGGARSDYAAMYNGHALLQPLSPFELKAGAILPGALLTAVDTARAGPVVASVTENVFDTVSGRHLLIPQGARLVGRHDGESRYGDRRAFITWERLILPNGKSLLLGQQPGVDAEGAIGVRGRVVRRLLPLAMATLFAGAITTLGQAARDDGDDSGGLLGDAGDAASIEAAQVGGRLIDRELEVRPSIRLRPGAPVRVLIVRDLILEPYAP